MSYHLNCDCAPATRVDAPASARSFLQTVVAFYAASGLAALLRAYSGRFAADGVQLDTACNGDDDRATDVSRLDADSRQATTRLERWLLKYLCGAIAGELGHLNSCTHVTPAAPRARAKSGLARWASSASSYYGSKYAAPCPDCDPVGALAFLRHAYRAFVDCAWSSAYGGVAWGRIAEAALVRLEARMLEQGCAIPAPTADTADGSDRCPKCGRLHADAPGPKSAFRCACAATADNGPACDVSRFAALPAVFVDYVLDLEHNTGSCLNKGWIPVNLDSLHEFQNVKRGASPADYAPAWGGNEYLRPALRCQAIAPVAPWDRQTGKATLEAEPTPAEPTPASYTVKGKTPQGTEYTVTVADGAVSAYKTCQGPDAPKVALPHPFHKTAEAATVADTVIGLYVALGTTKATAAAAALACPICGMVCCDHGKAPEPTPEPPKAPEPTPEPGDVMVTLPDGQTVTVSEVDGMTQVALADAIGTVASETIPLVADATALAVKVGQHLIDHPSHSFALAVFYGSDAVNAEAQPSAQPSPAQPSPAQPDSSASPSISLATGVSKATGLSWASAIFTAKGAVCTLGIIGTTLSMVADPGETYPSSVKSQCATIDLSAEIAGSGLVGSWRAILVERLAKRFQSGPLGFHPLRLTADKLTWATTHALAGIPASLLDTGKDS